MHTIRLQLAALECYNHSLVSFFVSFFFVIVVIVVVIIIIIIIFLIIIIVIIIIIIIIIIIVIIIANLSHSLRCRTSKNHAYYQVAISSIRMLRSLTVIPFC